MEIILLRRTNSTLVFAQIVSSCAKLRKIPRFTALPISFFVILAKKIWIMNRKYVLQWSALAVALLLFLLGGVFGLPLLRSVSSTDEPVLVYLDQDDTFDSLAVKLKATGKADMSRGLRLASLLFQYQDHVRPGCYDVGSGQCALTVMRQLRAGRQHPVRLTIPQTWTKEQLAARLSRQLMADSASLASLFNDAEALRAYETSPEMLVSLFIPDTYEVYWTLSPDALLKRMVKEYHAFWTDERNAMAEQLGLTRDEVAVLASIVRKYPNTFATMSQVSEVMGNFKSLKTDGTKVTELLDHGDGETL